MYKKPLVSFVVPAFNESEHILEESFASIISQTYTNFECIVIDESTNVVSSNKCKSLCNQDVRFKYIHPEKRIGLAASLNLGISIARGDLIARFDSDDICCSNRLEVQVKFMIANPDISVLGGNLQIINNKGETIETRKYSMHHSIIERRFQFTNAIAHPTVMFRKSVINTYGAYNPTFLYAEDLELWLRLCNKGVKCANLDQVLVLYRQQATQRDMKNWQYNLRARIRNFSTRYIILRLLGICSVALWGYLPISFQETLYKKIIFHKD